MVTISLFLQTFGHLILDIFLTTGTLPALFTSVFSHLSAPGTQYIPLV